MRTQGRKQQRGIAALTAILVVAIATVLAVNLLWTTSVDIQRTQSILLQDQARLYDLGGEELAKSLLAKDLRDDPGGSDTTADTSLVIARKFQDGLFEGWVVDQQGLFDLNSLVDRATTQADPVAKKQFENLLTLIDPDKPLDRSTAIELAEAAIDWIDPDDSSEASGAEEGYYTNLDPPYRPANFWFTSASELQAVKGFTPEILGKLRPHVTALPLKEPAGRWPLNVNTATDLVIASLVEGLSPDSVGAMCPYELQPRIGAKVCTSEFETKADFDGALSQATNGQPVPGIPYDLNSRWFLLTVTTSIGTARSTMYSLLERQEDGVRTRLRSFDAN